MNVYSIDVKLCATAYIRADTEDEARKIFDREFGPGRFGELPTDDDPVSGKQFDDPLLPEASLSSAVTFYGAWDTDHAELVEENL